MVYSREHGYAGAADCIGYRLDGSAIVVCDFKTSNSLATELRTSSMFGRLFP